MLLLACHYYTFVRLASPRLCANLRGDETRSVRPSERKARRQTLTMLIAIWLCTRTSDRLHASPIVSPSDRAR